MATQMPLPLGVCTDCQATAPVMEHVSGRMAIHCEHNQVGAIFQATADGASLWTLWTPMSHSEFVENVMRFAERFRLNLDDRKFEAQH